MSSIDANGILVSRGVDHVQGINVARDPARRRRCASPCAALESEPRVLVAGERQIPRHAYCNAGADRAPCVLPLTEMIAWLEPTAPVISTLRRGLSPEFVI